MVTWGPYEVGARRLGRSAGSHQPYTYHCGAHGEGAKWQKG